MKTHKTILKSQSVFSYPWVARIFWIRPCRFSLVKVKGFKGIKRKCPMSRADPKMYKNSRFPGPCSTGFFDVSDDKPQSFSHLLECTFLSITNHYGGPTDQTQVGKSKEVLQRACKDNG